MIQEQLNEVLPYLKAVRFKDDYTIFDLTVKEGWSFLKDDVVEVSELEGDNMYIIYCQTDEKSVDTLYSYTNKIIKYNLDREKKQKLFKEKVEELRVLFSKNSYDDLLSVKIIKVEGITNPEIYSNQLPDSFGSGTANGNVNTDTLTVTMTSQPGITLENKDVSNMVVDVVDKNKKKTKSLVD